VPPFDGAKYLLADAPAGARNVIEVRKEAKDGDDVVVIGRIGGEKRPIMQDQAVFSIVDLTLKPCNENPDDKCPFPWDYCHSPNLIEARVMVKFVDDGGKALAADTRRALGIKELQTVVVRGKARRDAEGNLSIQATGVHVKS
jgi:hypothetical protein